MNGGASLHVGHRLLRNDARARLSLLGARRIAQTLDALVDGLTLALGSSLSGSEGRSRLNGSGCSGWKRLVGSADNGSPVCADNASRAGEHG